MMTPELVFVFFIVLTPLKTSESKLSEDFLAKSRATSKLRDGTPKVLLSNNGPTTLGGATQFYAKVERHGQQGSGADDVQFTFCWFLPERKCKHTWLDSATFRWAQWEDPGVKTVKVTVDIHGHTDGGEHLENITTVKVTGEKTSNITVCCVCTDKQKTLISSSPLPPPPHTHTHVDR